MTAVLVAAGCGYEVAAIVTGVVPTLSALARRLPRSGRVVLAVAAGVWLAVHLLED